VSKITEKIRTELLRNYTTGKQWRAMRAHRRGWAYTAPRRRLFDSLKNLLRIKQRNATTSYSSGRDVA